MSFFGGAAGGMGQDIAAAEAAVREREAEQRHIAELQNEGKSGQEIERILRKEAEEEARERAKYADDNDWY